MTGLVSGFVSATLSSQRFRGHTAADESRADMPLDLLILPTGTSERPQAHTGRMGGSSVIVEHRRHRSQPEEPAPAGTKRSSSHGPYPVRVERRYRAHRLQRNAGSRTHFPEYRHDGHHMKTATDNRQNGRPPLKDRFLRCTTPGDLGTLTSEPSTAYDPLDTMVHKGRQQQGATGSKRIEHYDSSASELL